VEPGCTQYEAQPPLSVGELKCKKANALRKDASRLPLLLCQILFLAPFLFVRGQGFLQPDLHPTSCIFQPSNLSWLGFRNVLMV
jgi:hypothetical protein